MGSLFFFFPSEIQPMTAPPIDKTEQTSPPQLPISPVSSHKSPMVRAIKRLHAV